MTEAEARSTLEREGYKKIYSWFDSPDTEYVAHAHPNETSHIVIQGQMTIGIQGRDQAYGSGERVTVPANTEHVAAMGPDGCTYVMGERSGVRT